MLRVDQNDLITRTGPATPMGHLFRSYWTPALLLVRAGVAHASV